MTESPQSFEHNGLYFMRVRPESKRLCRYEKCEPSQTVLVGFRFSAETADQVGFMPSQLHEKLIPSEHAKMLWEQKVTVLFVTTDAAGKVTSQYTRSMTLDDLDLHFTWGDRRCIDDDLPSLLSAYQKSVLDPQIREHFKSDGFVAVFPVQEPPRDAAETVFYHRARPYKTEGGEIRVMVIRKAGGEHPTVSHYSDMSWEDFARLYKDREDMPLTSEWTAEAFLEPFGLSFENQEPTRLDHF